MKNENNCNMLAELYKTFSTTIQPVRRRALFIKFCNLSKRKIVLHVIFVISVIFEPVL